MPRLALPTLLGLAHGVSDAAAGFLIVQVLQLSVDNGVWLILLYNGLAFGLQPLAGLILDRLGQYQRGAAVGLFLTAAGFIVIRPSLPLGMLLVGLGSAFLHAGGGAVSITSTPGRASGPGIFASFGVMGLALGAQLGFYSSAITTTGFVISLSVLAILIWFSFIVFPDNSPGKQSNASTTEIFVLGLILAVALRSFVWTGFQADVPGYTQLALYMALAAGAGKLLGGFLSDRFGWRNWALSALLLSTFFLVAYENSILILILGVFLLQSLTPLSLAAMGRFLPSAPGLAASLVLGLSLLIGGIPSLFLVAEQLQLVVVIIPVLMLAGTLYWLVLKKQTL